MKTLLTTILQSLTAILPTKAANHEVTMFAFANGMRY